MSVKLFGYARVSVASDADADNLENQRRVLVDCEQVFEDVGSGASRNRPGLNRLKVVRPRLPMSHLQGFDIELHLCIEYLLEKLAVQVIEVHLGSLRACVRPPSKRSPTTSSTALPTFYTGEAIVRK